MRTALTFDILYYFLLLSYNLQTPKDHIEHIHAKHHDNTSPTRQQNRLDNPSEADTETQPLTRKTLRRLQKELELA
jgi:hypothetical protein